MFPAPFEYYRPSSLSEAVDLLAKHGEDAKVLAGGHSLIPAMKLRLAQPSALIDISGIAELSYIREQKGQIAIGPMTTYYALESSTLLRRKCPLMAEVARHVGDLQVRNKGTIGGSIVHADPAADYPAAILALDAQMHLCGPKGARVVEASNFFVGLLQSAVEPGEILCEICVPVTYRSVAYVKTEQKASGFALCGVAVVIEAGTARVSVGVTGVGATAYRASGVERVLNGKKLSDDIISEACRHAADGIEPLSDIHASAEYRAHLAAVNTRKALGDAIVGK